MDADTTANADSDAESAGGTAYELMAAPRLAIATILYVVLAGYAVQSSNLVQFLVVALSLALVSLYWGWDAWNYEKARARLTDA
jgi:hypothetical protein